MWGTHFISQVHLRCFNGLKKKLTLRAGKRAHGLKVLVQQAQQPKLGSRTHVKVEAYAF